MVRKFTDYTHMVCSQIGQTWLKEVEDAIFELDSRLNNLMAVMTATLIPDPAIAELGSTVNSTTLTWACNTDIESQTLDGEVISNELREFIYNTPLTASKTFTLVLTAVGGTTLTKSATIVFYNGIFYGASDSEVYNTTLINSLTKVLNGTKEDTISVTANEGEYIYYCIPTRMGNVTFTVNNFEGGFTKVATISYTNSNDYTEDYDIYKSDNTNLGETTIIIS